MSDQSNHRAPFFAVENGSYRRRKPARVVAGAQCSGRMWLDSSRKYRAALGDFPSLPLCPAAILIEAARVRGEDNGMVTSHAVEDCGSFAGCKFSAESG